MVFSLGNKKARRELERYKRARLDGKVRAGWRRLTICKCDSEDTRHAPCPAHCSMCHILAHSGRETRVMNGTLSNASSSFSLHPVLPLRRTAFEPCLFRTFMYFSQEVGCAGLGEVVLAWAAHILKWKPWN